MTSWDHVFPISIATNHMMSDSFLTNGGLSITRTKSVFILRLGGTPPTLTPSSGRGTSSQWLSVMADPLVAMSLSPLSRVGWC